ncbi:hypothetical protein [uncultured Legionella sp.]|uniref:hypothetical protein n=1 Tax=uncultured Legionella sp. TaxID=210934 RepID=UPI002620E172|nr:hypothetical protein [uncultured Legionella sp.]
MYRKSKTILWNKITIGLFLALTALMAQAGGPLWSFTPLTETDIVVAGNGIARVAYFIKNNSSREKTLVMLHRDGVQQMAPCKLGPAGQPNDTCLLRLTVHGNQVPGRGIEGLDMCQANADGSPNPNQCYHPAENNLKIKVDGVIIATPAGLTFPVSNSGTITIHQAGTSQPLHNIRAIIPAGSAINVSNNCPAILEPGASCTMNFTSPIPEGPTAIAITGINTNSFTINVTATSSNTASFAVGYSSYTLAAKDILTRERGVTEQSCADQHSTWDPVNQLCISSSRTISIHNSGPATAENVTYTISPPLPSGTTVTPASCGDIAPNTSCALTVTPGTTPTTSSASEPIPSILTASGTNTTSPFTTSITVLTYGNIFEGGYLFEINNGGAVSTPTVNGKVVSTIDVVKGLRWGPSVEVGGIDDKSQFGPNSCNGASNGQCNTARIMNANLSAPVAAAFCDYYTARINGYGYYGFYLPAICEMGFNTYNPGAHCGTAAEPIQQNIQSNLNAFHLMFGDFWSSTEGSTIITPAQNWAWMQYITPIPNTASQQEVEKSRTGLINVRCVRTFLG